MLKFYLKYGNEEEFEVYPIIKDDFGLKVSEDDNYSFVYVVSMNGSLLFFGNEFEYIRDVENKNVSFALRISFKEYTQRFKFKRHNGIFDFVDETYELQVATEDSVEELDNLFKEEVNALASGIQGKNIKTPLKPILQIYTLGSFYMTCYVDDYLWFEEVERATVSLPLLNECGFNVPVINHYIVCTSANFQSNTTRRWELIDDGTEKYLQDTKFASGSPNPWGKIKLQHIEVDGISHTRAVFLRASDDMITHASSPIKGRRWTLETQFIVWPNNIVLHPVPGTIGEGDIYVNVLGTAARIVVGTYPSDQSPIELPDDDIMPKSPYQYAFRGAQGSTAISFETTGDNYYETKPYLNKWVKTIPEKIAEGLPGGVEANRKYAPVANWDRPVSPQVWEAGGSVWLRLVHDDVNRLKNDKYVLDVVAEGFTVRDVLAGIMRKFPDNPYGPGLSKHIYVHPNNPFLENNQHTLYFIPKSNVKVWDYSSPAGVLNTSIEKINALIKAMFNVFVRLERTHMQGYAEYHSLRYARPQDARPTYEYSLLEQFARRTHQPITSKFGSVTSEKELVRQVDFQWGDTASDMFTGFPHEYSEAVPGLDKEQKKTVEVEDFTPDILSGYVNPDRFERDGAFVVIVDNETQAVRTSNVQVGDYLFRVLNGECSFPHLHWTRYGQEMYFGQVRMNQQLYGVLQKHTSLLEFDFPVGYEFVENITNLKITTQYGVGYIKEIDVNLGSLYATGTLKIQEQ